MFRCLSIGLLVVVSVSSNAHEWLSVLPQDASPEMAVLVAKQDGLDSLSLEKEVLTNPQQVPNAGVDPVTTKHRTDQGSQFHGRIQLAASERLVDDEFELVGHMEGRLDITQPEGGFSVEGAMYHGFSIDYATALYDEVDTYGVMSLGFSRVLSDELWTSVVGELSYGDQCVRLQQCRSFYSMVMPKGEVPNIELKLTSWPFSVFIGGQEAASNDDSLVPFGGLDFNVNLIEARVMLLGGFDKIIKGYSPTYGQFNDTPGMMIDMSADAGLAGMGLYAARSIEEISTDIAYASDYLAIVGGYASVSIGGMRWSINLERVEHADAIDLLIKKRLMTSYSQTWLPGISTKVSYERVEKIDATVDELAEAGIEVQF